MGSDASMGLPRPQCLPTRDLRPTCQARSQSPEAAPGGLHHLQSVCQGSLQRQMGFWETKRNPSGTTSQILVPEPMPPKETLLPPPTLVFLASVSATGVQDETESNTPAETAPTWLTMPRAQGGETSPRLQRAVSSGLGGGQGQHLAAQFILYVLQQKRSGVGRDGTGRAAEPGPLQGPPPTPASESQSLSKAALKVSTLAEVSAKCAEG